MESVTSMDMSVKVQGDRTVVVLTGELDATAHEALGRGVAEARTIGLPIDVDLGGVTFMDSAGISAVARLAAAGPDRLRVFRAAPFVQELLEITGVDQIVQLMPPPDATGSRDERG